MHQSPLHARLEAAAGDRTDRHLAELTQLVPPDQREGVVDAVEARTAAQYASAQHTGAPMRPFTAISAARQRDGYFEQVETEYEVKPSAAHAPSKRAGNADPASSNAHRTRRPRRA